MREATVPVAPPSLTDLVFATDRNTLFVLAVLMASSLGLTWGVQLRLSIIGASGADALIQNRLPYLNDGGDNITQIVLIYMMFVLPAGARYTRGGLKVWFHNLAVVAIFVQLIILYATSGLAKVSGSKWEHGVAVYYISQVEWFSLPWVRHFLTNSVLVTFATYVPMLYQVFFPFAIFSRLKLPWIAIGVLFHLGTAAFMNLITFGTVMIGLELFLITNEEYCGLYTEVRRYWAHPPMLPLRAMHSVVTSFSSSEPRASGIALLPTLSAFRYARQRSGTTRSGAAKESVSKNAAETDQKSVAMLKIEDKN